MCLGLSCTVRKDCYRYRAKSDGDNQTYGNFDDKISRINTCPFFWPLEKAEGPLAEIKEQSQGPAI